MAEPPSAGAHAAAAQKGSAMPATFGGWRSHFFSWASKLPSRKPQRIPPTWKSPLAAPPEANCSMHALTGAITELSASKGRLRPMALHFPWRCQCGPAAWLCMRRLAESGPPVAE